MLSRRRAGVPAGTKGRLGGFLPRRTQTLPVRAAAARPEGPPERARMLREKRTFRPSGIARKNAKRPQGRDAGPAGGEDGSCTASCVGLGKRSWLKFFPATGRTTPVFTTRFGMTAARIRADLHVHRRERNQNDSLANALASGGWHRPPLWHRHWVGVKVHAFTMPRLPAGGRGRAYRIRCSWPPVNSAGASH